MWGSELSASGCIDAGVDDGERKPQRGTGTGTMLKI